MKRCGFVGIIGRANVGKSTLMNAILGQKISIISNKPQTTRHRIHGIKTYNAAQIIYVDTPGMQQHRGAAVNRYMNSAAEAACADVEVVAFLVEALKFTDADQHILSKLKSLQVPVVLVITKIDKVKQKQQLLPFLAAMQARHEFADIVPIAAPKGQNLEELEQALLKLLPEQAEFFYPADMHTDQDWNFRAAELIREPIMQNLGAEVPHGASVQVESMQRQQKCTHIDAIIWVEREGQKPIIIGKQGLKLRKIGQQARLQLEQALQHKVFLKLWVKVKRNWSRDTRSLQALGFK